MTIEKSIKLDKLALGTCYYPEHWDRSLWKDDLNRMKEAGIETIRIAEFAWSKAEPLEGQFTYEFFDDFLDIAEETQMQVIMGTPTATPPAWLTQKYPEVLNCDINGVPFRHGARRHYNYNSKKYQELSARIVTKMAQHYGKRSSVIGWQIDNELNCETDVFYSESDTLAFREYLKNKYKDLDALNAAWGTVFWNQTYTEWEEIHVPRTTISNSTNPHEVMDYIRFISDSACRFAKMQSDILRTYKKDSDFITTNGMFSHLDNHRMTKESLDFYMYDSYPNFAYCLCEDPLHSDDLNDRKWSRNLTEVRSVSPNFGIMEQQSGANGWNTRMEAPAPKPGQMTLWTMQSVAHGADYISYFRWRTAIMGTEIYWHGILDYANRDNRRLEEVREIHGKFRKIGELAGSRYQASFGVIKDYDNVWDADLDVWHQRMEKVSQKGIFEAAQLTHTPMDYVYLTEDVSLQELLKYPLLFYPHGIIITNKRKALLEAYVQEGGILILGCRTGYKDRTGKCVMQNLPGLMQELSGTDVTDGTFIGKADGKVMVGWEDCLIEAAVYNDILEPLTDQAEILGTYQSNYYKGAAGLIKNNWGKGKVYYFGGAFTRDTAEVFLRKLCVAEPYQNMLQLPRETELAVREKDGRQYIFVLNYSHEPVWICLKQSLLDLYTGAQVMGTMEMKPYETKVFLRNL